MQIELELNYGTEAFYWNRFIFEIFLILGELKFFFKVIWTA